MDNWDEVRTAYHVARAGTVSGAAEALGVHHATVIRHIDALEGRLGVKLFQRHARGYTPTEAGEDLLRVAKATDDQFAQLAGRIKGRGEDVSGEMVITALAELTPILAPMLSAFQAGHPGLILRLLASERVFRLEYGEAHVAIRAGTEPPGELDNVVQKLAPLAVGLYGSHAYLKAHGKPEGEGDLTAHRFVSSDDPDSRAPFSNWLRRRVSEEAITFRTDDFRAQEQAIRAGAGLGFLMRETAAGMPDVEEVLSPDPAWEVTLWLVTHMDLHRTAKVQALVRFLKERMA
ncbi:LysR family transcriptional regulator [Rhodalgimonas zhirmunskyi]|uniref:LysR family transcriptional regulator n=1 Tax=Rhodalgimonas zhirmunskyi TaxID=2964767 RepID=A0AAJ1UGN3_9RHOB|nr:LysR family transcriptional regulator [Rhodoalgimonas zhirmunskyi]MDQ2095817.1 LysR family transcriptional regulator [Rhodoalgimonas zhirmunskyi]